MFWFSQQPSAPPQSVSHTTTPYSTNGMHHQQPAPPVTSGMIPTSYSSGLAFHSQQSIGSEPLRPIARAPLQVLNMDDLQRAQSSQQPMIQSDGPKYMTQLEKVGSKSDVLVLLLAIFSQTQTCFCCCCCCCCFIFLCVLFVLFLCYILVDVFLRLICIPTKVHYLKIVNTFLFRKLSRLELLIKHLKYCQTRKILF